MVGMKTLLLAVVVALALCADQTAARMRFSGFRELSRQQGQASNRGTGNNGQERPEQDDRCNDGEIYIDCAELAEQRQCTEMPAELECGVEPVRALVQCEEGCRCRPGLLRNQDGTCVSRRECNGVEEQTEEQQENRPRPRFGRPVNMGGRPGPRPSGQRPRPQQDPCLLAPCKNQGSCFSVGAEYNCLCPNGYSGVNCEIGVPSTTTTYDYDNYDYDTTTIAGDIWSTTRDTAQVSSTTNPTTTTTFKSDTTTTSGGLWSTTADTVQHICDSDEQICLNGGKCKRPADNSPLDVFVCDCPAGFFGTYCEQKEVDECEGDHQVFVDCMMAPCGLEPKEPVCSEVPARPARGQRPAERPKREMVDCLPGCRCMPGYARDANNECVPIRMCIRDATGGETQTRPDRPGRIPGRIPRPVRPVRPRPGGFGNRPVRPSSNTQGGRGWFGRR